MSSANNKTNCYDCKSRRTISGDCHTQCIKPDPGMTGNEHGKEHGWFMYPFNFDPIWKTKECANFEAKDSVVSNSVSQATDNTAQNDQG